MSATLVAPNLSFSPVEASDPSGVDASLARNAEHYDKIPYISKPFPQSHPARLAGIAQFFGLDAPPLASARVLELGCASGGNLIPLAECYPKGQFVGVDLSPVQVAQGAARIRHLGLKNIELRRMSITEIDESFGAFDYIICHGVYSWVPAPVRAAILRVCRDRLSRNGIAYNSYNVLPGWRQKQALRDALLLYTGDPTSPDGSARAHEIMGFLEAHTHASTPYGVMVRSTVASLANLGDDYIFHEYLESENAPCTFTEFAGDAAAHDLAYLAEVEIASMLPESVNAAAAQRLRELSNNRLIATEQCIDLMTGRTFRQTLLIHAARASDIVRQLSASRLESLNILTTANLALLSEENGRFTFGDSSGRTLATNSAATAAALQRLVAAFPCTATLDDLVSPAKKRSKLAVDQERAEILDALFKMVTVGLVSVSAEPVRAAARSKKPRALRIAREDTAIGHDSTVNARHESINLDVVSKSILPLLDGSADDGGLRQHIIAQEARDAIVFQRQGARVTEPDAIAECAADHLERALNFLARAGVLVS